MNRSSQLEHYKQQMASRGVSGATAFPPAWHVFWSLGVKVPPPPFLGFASLALITGGLFGSLFGFIAWLLGNRGIREMPAAEAAWVALITGTIFGLIMAAYYRGLARKHRLGSWAAFPDSQPGT
ncbi:MAG: hypothetical protein K0M70_13685 [Arenimonas sp.]|uniref:DUF6404 family protein n=1 Tax=Arenimonas sp. TaxID=1872635 RepID=UPI0025BABC88|nr:DUF6404 family protein [Arenimonas sp.]MBW8368896.1 hypothetical protein [Arenimonas sp.]